MKQLTETDIREALSHPIFKLISETADELGLECYVIGGWVRDLFLERPSKDIDVVVVGGGIERPGIVIAEALKTKLGKAITNLGKSEAWLMLEFEGDKNMWFKGRNDRPVALAEISLFGRASGSQYDKMTEKVTGILSQELGISADCIYVKYEETENWGWNGGNF
mgnify:CR=1 FL=1